MVSKGCSWSQYKSSIWRQVCRPETFMILTSHCTISFIGATSLARNRSLLYQAECSGFHRGAENHTSGSHVGCPTERRIAHFAVERHLDGCHLELILTGKCQGILGHDARRYRHLNTALPTEEMHGSDGVPDLTDYKRAWVGKGKTINESERALFSDHSLHCRRDELA